MSSSSPTWLHAEGKVQVCPRRLILDLQSYEVYSYTGDGRRIYKTSCFVITDIPVTKTSHMENPYIQVVGKCSSGMSYIITCEKISVDLSFTERKQSTGKKSPVTRNRQLKVQTWCSKAGNSDLVMEAIVCIWEHAEGRGLNNKANAGTAGYTTVRE